EALCDPAAYLHPVGTVEVRQTHISVVFLAGDRAYKVKKPVEMGFLDFRELESRRRCCEDEVRLNRRLAPGVYLGVVGVTTSATGVRVGEPCGRGGGGVPDPPGVSPGSTIIEWAVKMKRLADDATLRSRLLRGEVGVGLLEELARRLAAFHTAAE